jgi:hypothetical protein
VAPKKIKHFFRFTPSTTFRLCPPLRNFDGVIAIFESRDGSFFRSLPDVTVVLHHFATYVPGECANCLFAVARIFEKPRDEGMTQIVPAVLQSSLPKCCVPRRLPLAYRSLEINGVNKRAASISRKADLVAWKNECLGVSLGKSGEPQREHVASPHRQRDFPSGAGVRLRFRDNQLASRNHSVSPFEIQVSAAKCLCLARAQNRHRDRERRAEAVPDSGSRARGMYAFGIFVEKRLANVVLLFEPIDVLREIVPQAEGLEDLSEYPTS